MAAAYTAACAEVAADMFLLGRSAVGATHIVLLDGVTPVASYSLDDWVQNSFELTLAQHIFTIGEGVQVTSVTINDDDGASGIGPALVTMTPAATIIWNDGGKFIFEATSLFFG